MLNLLNARQPLYRVQEEFALTDTALLVGAGIAAADVTDEALGRALDKRAVAGGAAVFSAVAARAWLHDEGWTPNAALFVKRNLKIPRFIVICPPKSGHWRNSPGRQRSTGGERPCTHCTIAPTPWRLSSR